LKDRKIQEDIAALDKLWIPLAKAKPKIGIILARWFAFYNGIYSDFYITKFFRSLPIIEILTNNTSLNFC
jgi:hypothetical protein